MSTPAPRLEMTDQQIEDLAENTGVRLKVSPAQVREIMDRHLEDLCRSKREGAHAPEPDQDQ